MDSMIRKARAADTAAIEALFVDMLQAVYHTDDVKGYEPDYLLRFFGSSDDCIFVAEEKSSVIAYVSVEIKREGVFYAYIDDFCVNREYRGFGIGTRLLRRAEEYAEALGIGDILLHVEAANTSAARLYRKNGYDILRTEGSRHLMRKGRPSSNSL